MPVYRRPYVQGNSVVVTLPLYMLEEQGIEPGDYFIVSRFESDGILLKRVSSEHKEGDRWARKGTWRTAKPVPAGGGGAGEGLRVDAVGEVADSTYRGC